MDILSVYLFILILIYIVLSVFGPHELHCSEECPLVGKSTCSLWVCKTGTSTLVYLASFPKLVYNPYKHTYLKCVHTCKIESVSVA
jgi:hypothetical protein